MAFSQFRGTPEDEAPLASQVATRYGATHIVKQVTEAEFKADLPFFLEAMDQPSIDGVNTWFVAKATREAGIKVALSGLGGDEIFAGYPSFKDIPRWVNSLRGFRFLPGLGQGIRYLGAATKLAKRSPKALGLVEYGGTYPGAYLLRRGLLLPFELNTVLEPSLVRNGLRRLNLQKMISRYLEPDPGTAISRICALESGLYMRNQLLRDSDWASMAHSVELRTPLVDFETFGRSGTASMSFSCWPRKTRTGPNAIKTVARAGGKQAENRLCRSNARLDAWCKAYETNYAHARGLVSRDWATQVFQEFRSVA